MAKVTQKLESYDDLIHEAWSQPAENRQADRAASLDDVTTFIYQSLVDYQGKWNTSNVSEWTIRFPYARYLSVGDSIKNETTGEFYTITAIIEERTNTVQLSGTTVPRATDILRLENSNMVNFVSAFPQVLADPADWRDTITFRVSRREPGSMQPHPFGDRKEIKPRVRQIITDPDYPDHHIQILGQWFDNIIQFDCWSVTNNGADGLISWLETFMYRYTWVWKKNGVQEILYTSRSIDEEVTKWRDDIVNRTLYYYFRTEKIVPIREMDFTQFDLSVELGADFEVTIAPSGLPASGMLNINDKTLPVV